MGSLREHRRGRSKPRQVTKYNRIRKEKEQSNHRKELTECRNYWVQANNAYFNEDDEDVNEVYKDYG